MKNKQLPSRLEAIIQEIARIERTRLEKGTEQVSDGVLCIIHCQGFLAKSS